MPARIIKLLFLLTTFGVIFSYLFVYNGALITVSFGGNHTWQAPLAIVLTVAFGLGATVTAAIAFLYAVRSSFFDWRATKRRKKLAEHQELIVKAREQVAAGNYTAAKLLFRQVLDYDPENIVARILLAAIERQEGHLQDALKVLDEARQQDRRNLELLFLAAEVNEEMGNQTAAYDNLVLALQLDPMNRKALTKLVFCCRNLRRFTDAAEFQSQLIRVSPREEWDLLQYELAAIRFDQIKTLPENERKQAFEELLRRHKDFPPALAELALLEQAGSKFKNATKLWTRAFQASQDVTFLEQLSALWLSINDPQTAISAVRHAIFYSVGEEQILPRTRLYFIAFLLHLEMVSDARIEVEKLLASKQLLSDDELLLIATLEARLLQREGKLSEAFSSLLQAIEKQGAPYTQSNSERGVTTRPLRYPSREQPSPRLSTP